MVVEAVVVRGGRTVGGTVVVRGRTVCINEKKVN